MSSETSSVLRDERVWLADIVEACERIAQYTSGMDEAAFRADRKTVDAVVRNLEVIGEAVKRLSAATKALSPTIEWKRIAGMRDVLIHAYFGVDEPLLWTIVQQKVPELRRAAGDLVQRCAGAP